MAKISAKRFLYAVKGSRAVIHFKRLKPGAKSPSWLDQEVEDVLKRHRIANVSVSSQAMPMHLKPTANFVYVRFQGLKGGSAHDYTDSELEPWAEHLRRCARQGSKGFAYFNNDVNTRAPLNARRLIEMVGKYAAKPGANSQIVHSVSTSFGRYLRARAKVLS